MLQLWMPVSSVVIDPASQVLYAGAPEWYPRGVFKSADGGDTWDDTGLSEGIAIASLAVSQSVVYAGTSHGVLKSIGGTNWTAASGGIQEPATSVAVSSANPDVAYAGTNSALFYTVDGGGSWSPVLPYPVISVTIAPSNPSVAYVATWYGSGMTEDGGMFWQASGPEGTNLGVFAIDPLDARRVYGGGSVGWDSFVTRIGVDGSRLDYSTFIGGASSEWDTDISVDSSGAAYVAGTTQSTDFPVLNPFQPNAGGLMDVFVAKISEAGSLVYIYLPRRLGVGLCPADCRGWQRTGPRRWPYTVHEFSDRQRLSAGTWRRLLRCVRHRAERFGHGARVLHIPGGQ